MTQTQALNMAIDALQCAKEQSERQNNFMSTPYSLRCKSAIEELEDLKKLVLDIRQHPEYQRTDI